MEFVADAKTTRKIQELMVRTTAPDEATTMVQALGLLQKLLDGLEERRVIIFWVENGALRSNVDRASIEETKAAGA